MLSRITLAAALLTALSCSPEIDTLSAIREGGLAARVTDALTGAPIAGATIRAGDRELVTNAEGVFILEAPLPERLSLSAESYHATETHAPKFLDAAELPELSLMPDRELDESELKDLAMFGTGANDGVQDHQPLPEAGPISLDAAGTPGALSVGGRFELPRTIRVGRTFTDGGGCPPVRAVEEIALEDYVKGAVTSEIGVFRHTAGGGDSAAMEAYKTLAVAARSYVVYFYLLNPAGNFTAVINGRNVRYHIADTACHQRYDDPRHGPIDRAVNATRGKILLNAGGRAIDKYEYAASCGRHGTRPEFRTALVGDRPGVRACVGSWCGHDSCAGHEGCVVRGICQWGSLERSKRGDAYTSIIAHYQPELELTEIGAPTTTPPPPQQTPSNAIIVDNTTPDRFRASGSWEVSSWAEGRIGANYRWRNPASVSDTASYKAAIRGAGNYEVYARVPGNGYNTNAPYVIHHAGGSTTVRRDISDRGGQWVSLGTYEFPARDDWFVQVSCWTNGQGYVIADAVKFEAR